MLPMKTPSARSSLAVQLCRRLAEIILVLLLVSATGLAWGQSADVPLVPRTVFDAPAEHDSVTISPNGKSLGYIAPSDKDIANIWVEDLTTHQKRMVTRTQ